MILGIDFDNTIADYNALMLEIALEWGLVAPGYRGDKKAIRESIRSVADGELQWRRLQAAAYGDRIDGARLMPGVEDVLTTCKRREIPVYIISHKTEYSNLGESQTNLRAAALTWLETRGFFDAHGFGLVREDVLFHDTREEKIERIRAMKVTHFIDDLEEFFREPAFPNDVVRILLGSLDQSSDRGGIHSFGSWDEIGAFLFSDGVAVEASVPND